MKQLKSRGEKGEMEGEEGREGSGDKGEIFTQYEKVKEHPS